MTAFLKKRRGWTDEQIKAELEFLDCSCPSAVADTKKELPPEFGDKLEELMDAMESGDPEAWAAGRKLRDMARATLLKKAKEN